MTLSSALDELPESYQDWLDGAGLSPCKVENLIKRIFREIGSCDTCTYSETIMDETPMEYLVCKRGCFDPIADDFYCADFEEEK